jgi:hypothetical protein
MTQDATNAYLEGLLAGSAAQLLAGFAGEPTVDDPQGGRVRGAADFERFARTHQEWLIERSARIEPLRTTRGVQRTVFEALLHLQLAETAAALPIAVVGDHADERRLKAIRVYHSLWPLHGAHQVRSPLLQHDPTLAIADVISEYQGALAAGDVEAIVATFEPDGYFREPAGGEYFYRGSSKLGEFMAHILGTGGIGLEHCTVTDDGVACAIEFNAVQFGRHKLQPQAGVAVYERGSSGRLCAARVYDDVNVEALAARP